MTRAPFVLAVRIPGSVARVELSGDSLEECYRDALMFAGVHVGLLHDPGDCDDPERCLWCRRAMLEARADHAEAGL